MKFGAAALAAVFAILQAAPGTAQQSPAYPGVTVDAKTLSVQAKAEELFEQGDYRRAHFIYRNELAPIGDKYAQYMLGFMCLEGLGVEQDPVLAAAWYRLAAERNAPEFVAVRDELLDQLDDVDLRRSDELYLRLRREYSDVVLRMRLVREDYELLTESSTGSRVGGSGSAITVVRPRTGTGVSGDAYYGQVRRRMQKHLDHITFTLGIDRVDADLTPDELARLEQQVHDYVGVIGDR